MQSCLNKMRMSLKVRSASTLISTKVIHPIFLTGKLRKEMTTLLPRNTSKLTIKQ